MLFFEQKIHFAVRRTITLKFNIMESNSFWYLQNINLETLLCPNKLAHSEGEGAHESKVYKKGDFIYLPEEEANKIFFISEGRIKISSSSDEGKEVTKAILSTGELFGELGLIGETKRKDSAIAMEKTMVCSVTVDDMKNLMRDHSSLSMFLMKLMGSRVLEMEQRLESLVFKDSKTRIIEFLHELGAKKGDKVGFEVVVRKFITHQEIANLTATSRQTVTTVLNELRNNELITFDRRRLLIRDMDRLRVAAKVA